MKRTLYSVGTGWIWNWPWKWNDIRMRNDAQMTGMTSEWFNMVLSLLKRQQHIKSFRSHSFHSRLILKRMSSSEIEWDKMTEMTSEWFNMVLSLLKRQQHIKSFIGHSFHSRLIQKRMSSSEIEWGMMLNWQKWPLNDLIWCCLF